MDPTTRSLSMGAAGAESGPVESDYVENVFSISLYTGTGSNLTVSNGINLSSEGGMVLFKGRNDSDYMHFLDSSNNWSQALLTPSTLAGFATSSFTANTNGFTQGADYTRNRSGLNVATWTFRKCPGFFDVISWTGNGVSGRQVSHNLGGVPGFVIIKRTDSGGTGYRVWHFYYATSQYSMLNTDAGIVTSAGAMFTSYPGTTVLTLGSDSSVNASGGSYVAYLFANADARFGVNKNQSIIRCTSYFGNGSTTGPIIDLGWEPQWIMIKNGGATGDWNIIDNMRGFVSNGTDREVSPNLIDGESTGTFVTPLSSGFQINTTNSGYNASGNVYNFVAIRRGPMKTPTDATRVFALNARTGTGANATVSGSQVVDAILIKNRGSAVGDLFSARLTGTGYMETSSTSGEVAAGTTILQANPWDVMDGVKVGTTSTITNASSNTFINYLFRCAPGFFDVVAYAGTSNSGTLGTQTLRHSLGVAPELIISKPRNTTANWVITNIALGNGLNFSTAAALSSITFAVTSTTFEARTFGGAPFTSYETNALGSNYIAYLFASCPGVSKVGSYTGTGTTLNVDCGFTAGARFVMIKRTDSTGDWYVWDTARGIVSGDDPYILLNSTAAEVTNTDFIDPLSSGFQISSTAPAAINANGGTFIYLAIA